MRNPKRRLSRDFNKILGFEVTAARPATTPEGFAHTDAHHGGFEIWSLSFPLSLGVDESAQNHK